MSRSTLRGLGLSFTLAASGCIGPKPLVLSGPQTGLAFCGLPIAGLDSLRESPLVVLGEVHGLTAPPAFAADLACRLGSDGQPVLLGLEIPKQEQARIDAFLESPSQSARISLLAGDFWKSSFQDGRSSEARLEMLETLRRLNQGGAKIRVVAFDDSEVEPRLREKTMADNILAARRPAEKTLVLVGNLHARTVPGAPGDPGVVWMSVLLREREVRLVSFDNRYLGGTAWTCSGAEPSTCGVRPIRGEGVGEAWRIERSPPADAEGYDGVFQLGPAVASGPAKDWH